MSNQKPARRRYGLNEETLARRLREDYSAIDPAPKHDGLLGRRGGLAERSCDGRQRRVDWSDRFSCRATVRNAILTSCSTQHFETNALGKRQLRNHLEMMGALYSYPYGRQKQPHKARNL